MVILEKSPSHFIFRLSSHWTHWIDFLIGFSIGFLILLFNAFVILFILAAISGSGRSQLHCQYSLQNHVHCQITAHRSRLLDTMEQHDIRETHRANVEVTRRGFAIYLYGAQQQEALFTVVESRDHAEDIAQRINHFIQQPIADTLTLENLQEYWLVGLGSRTGGVVMFILIFVGALYFRPHFAGTQTTPWVWRVGLFTVRVLFFGVDVAWRLLRQFQTTTIYLNKTNNTCKVVRHHLWHRLFFQPQEVSCALSDARLQIRRLSQENQAIDYRLSLHVSGQEYKIAYYHAPLSQKQHDQLAQQIQYLEQYLLSESS
ncbi:hypothetical protein [Thioflexithrix psekupsensis]|uniref:Uncharacterized protein n=1 Tax=Thioflexithrix psekupsensis TaxID=1570016 RepID=A0A251X7E3_9GAMM|nr:hypothetical protein [Thioflexithrix psekupsensis]OUD13109.1 hypothetical protein TPSD3_10695 [Thioflexithrix psekupsensis]